MKATAASLVCVSNTRLDMDGMKDRWIRKHWEYQLIYREGIKRVGKCVLLYARIRKDEPSRFGIAVTRKLGTSVVRNTIKRRIREVIRKNANRIGEGMDLVVVARKDILRASFEQIEKELLALVERGALDRRSKRKRTLGPEHL